MSSPGVVLSDLGPVSDAFLNDPACLIIPSIGVVLSDLAKASNALLDASAILISEDFPNGSVRPLWPGGNSKVRIIPGVREVLSYLSKTSDALLDDSVVLLRHPGRSCGPWANLEITSIEDLTDHRLECVVNADFMPIVETTTQAIEESSSSYVYEDCRDGPRNRTIPMAPWNDSRIDKCFCNRMLLGMMLNLRWPVEILPASNNLGETKYSCKLCNPNRCSWNWSPHSTLAEFPTGTDSEFSVLPPYPPPPPYPTLSERYPRAQTSLNPLDDRTTNLLISDLKALNQTDEINYIFVLATLNVQELILCQQLIHNNGSI
ncbi:hypothetical protein DFH09DRAFT_1069195 [Mycena vulgaris]|nr:hypothetical protein DFH09DRAFT_1069195 [Mycena vulgaris]